MKIIYFYISLLTNYIQMYLNMYCNSDFNLLICRLFGSCKAYELESLLRCLYKHLGILYTFYTYKVIEISEIDSRLCRVFFSFSRKLRFRYMTRFFSSSFTPNSGLVVCQTHTHHCNLSHYIIYKERIITFVIFFFKQLVRVFRKW